jgi:hypothetical protein
LEALENRNIYIEEEIWICMRDISEYVKAWLEDEERLDEMIGDRDYAFGWTGDLWKDGRRIGWIIFVDYDTQNLGKVVRDCKALQKRWKLGNGIILSTTHGYHLYVLDVVGRKKLVKVMRSSGGDRLYVEMGIKSNYDFNIRLGRKDGEGIRYERIVPSAYGGSFSASHFLFLCRKYPKLMYDAISLKSPNSFMEKKGIKGQMRFTIYRVKKNEKRGI